MIAAPSSFLSPRSMRGTASSMRVLAGPVLAVALAAAHGGACAQAVAKSTEAELLTRLEKMAAELEALKAQMKAVQAERVAAQPSAPAASVAPTVAPVALAETTPTRTGPATVLTSYGEINLNRPLRSGRDSTADLRRFVIGFQHRVDERTKVVAELEVEHAVASATDDGEVAIEQAYVERELNPTWAARGGLFLMPVGFLNENHEPHAFYGVERNFVETAIIPSTWREGGVQFIGNFDNGLTLQTGVSTGFNLNKWDATSTEGQESPLGSIHQEMAQAKARDLAVYGALNWRGVPGLQLGGSFFTGGVSHATAGAPAARTTLWDLHARWMPERWDLSALFASGTISNTAAWNTTLVGNASLVPARFDGGYLQAAYRLWQEGDQAFTPFVRWEAFNTARSYADLGSGVTPSTAVTERVLTMGANYRLNSAVVVKADLQRFQADSSRDRVNLGLGWSF